MQDFTPDDLERVQQDMQRMPSNNDDGSYVVELNYDMWSGHWRYMQIRPDKAQGNHIRTVIDTMQTIAENVTQEELAYRVAVPPQVCARPRRFCMR